MSVILVVPSYFTTSKLELSPMILRLTEHIKENSSLFLSEEFSTAIIAGRKLIRFVAVLYYFVANETSSANGTTLMFYGLHKLNMFVIPHCVAFVQSHLNVFNTLLHILLAWNL